MWHVAPDFKEVRYEFRLFVQIYLAEARRAVVPVHVHMEHSNWAQ